MRDQADGKPEGELHAPGQPFDEYEHSYGEAVADALAFGHQGHDFFTRAKVRHLLRLIEAQAGRPAEQSVLDFGCGPGLTDGHLVATVGSLAGVDVSEAMVTRASADNPEVDYRTYDGTTLPWADDTFDVTFTICVLHHVEPGEWSRVVSEMARVTRPGGLVVVFEHNPWNPLTRRAVTTCTFDEGVTLLSMPTTRRLLRDAGLHEVASRHILFVPFGDRVSDLADRALGWLPLGGQYLSAAQVPRDPS